MGTQALQFGTARAFVEHCTTDDCMLLTVPTVTAASAEGEPEAQLDQQEHALSSAAFFPPAPASAAGFVLSRIIDDGYTLELRWVSLVAGGRGLDERSSPPARFAFPARVVPSPAFAVVASGDLHVQAVTVDGHLHVLWFRPPGLFTAEQLHDETWSAEFRIDALAGGLHTPVLMHGVDETTLVVACADGFVLSVQFDLDHGAITNEVELKRPPRSLNPARALASVFSSRNLAAAASVVSSPSQLLSLASSPHLACAFGISRDRKLKIWSLAKGACLNVIDLPSTPLDLAPLAPNPQPLTKVVPGDDGALFLAIFSHAGRTFNLYAITADDGGSVSELQLVAEIACDSAPGQLVDFDVNKFSPAGERERWTLWTLWEDGGSSEVRFADVPELAGESIDDEDERTWTAVEPTTTGGEWNAGYFDELLDDDAEAPTVFLQHLLYPGRYAPATLAWAVETYANQIMDETNLHSRPIELELEYESTAHRIAALVGCSIGLEHSEATGAPLYQQYHKRVKAEWLRLVAIANEARQAALFPLALAVDPSRGAALVLMRDAITVPVVQDTALVLQRLVTPPAQAERTAFLKLAPAALEQSYEHLAPRGVRHDLFVILGAIAILEGALAPTALRTVESRLLATVRAPFTQHVASVAAGLWDDVLEQFVSTATSTAVLDSLRTLLSPEAAFQVLWALLTTADVVRTSQQGPTSPISDLATALLSDSLTSSIEGRYALARGLATLLVLLNGDDDAGGLVPELDSLTSASLATLHTLASLRWIAQQSATPATAPTDALESAFGDMHVGAATAVVHPFSLLNGLLRLSQYSPPLAIDQSLASALTVAQGAFVTRTGLVTQKRQVVDAPQDVEFALMLYQVGLPDLALEFAEMYPQGAGMRFVVGRALLETGRGDEAVDAFRKAAPALYEPVVRLDDASGISHVLPVDIAGSLARYYRHIIDLFLERDLHAAVVTFATLALDAAADEGDDDVDELWAIQFTGNVDLGLYEDAYVSLMAVPSHKTKLECLSQLVSAVCENSQVQLLTRWSFVGLQPELERLLSQRADQADPLASPNYHRILYAYYVSKGDYRSAGATMFQQGRRIGKIKARDLDGQHELATMQCQSYLAAANALALVDEKHAWVTVGDEDAAAGEPTSKRRKITYCIPDKVVKSASPGVAQSARPAEIVELADIRREYTIVLSRLELSEGDEYGELGRTTITVDPSATVKAYALRGAYESALTTAHALDVDMSDLFEKLTESCVALSRTTSGLSSSITDWVALSPDCSSWEGTLASKAWRLLEAYLTRYDDDSLKYSLIVLERSLAVDPHGKVPSWLLDAFVARDAPLLVRTMLKYDRLNDAFAFSLVAIRSAIPISETPAASSLPYALFDQLLALKPEETVAFEPQVLKERQEELRNVIAARLAAVERADRIVARRVR